METKVEKKRLYNSDIKYIELKKKISDAFHVFDNSNSNLVDIREISTIVRSLGRYPTEMDVQELCKELEKEETPGLIEHDRFVQFMADAIMENKYPPYPREKVLAAFQFIEKMANEVDGTIDPEHMQTLMMEEGEPFSQEELDEMYSVAVDPDKKRIVYDKYINYLITD